MNQKVVVCLGNWRYLEYRFENNTVEGDDFEF